MAGQPSKVVFRTDANNRIGTGHLNRCLLLADLIRSKYKIHSAFIIKDSDNSISELINRRNFSISSPAFNHENTLKGLQSEFPEASILVIDLDDPSYYEERFQESIMKHGLKLMYITANDMVSPGTLFVLLLDGHCTVGGCL